MLSNRVKNIFIIFLIIILSSGVSIYATYNYFAQDVKYTKQDGTTISVEEALNDLYTQSDSAKLISIFSARGYNNTLTLATNTVNDNLVSDDSSVITFKKSGTYKLFYEIIRGYASTTGTLYYYLNNQQVQLAYVNSELCDNKGTIELSVEEGDVLYLTLKSGSAKSIITAFACLYI